MRISIFRRLWYPSKVVPSPCWHRFNYATFVFESDRVVRPYLPMMSNDQQPIENGGSRWDSRHFIHFPYFVTETPSSDAIRARYEEPIRTITTRQRTTTRIGGWNEGAELLKVVGSRNSGVGSTFVLCCADRHCLPQPSRRGFARIGRFEIR